MSEIKWIKLSTNLFDDEKIRLIESLPDADTILVIWFKLLSLAGKTNASGFLLLNRNIPYTTEHLATLFNRNITQIRYALQTFQQFGMIEVDETQTIYITNWEKHQSVEQMEKLKNRERQQRFRDKQKLLAQEVVQSENAQGATHEFGAKNGAKHPTFGLVEPMEMAQSTKRITNPNVDITTTNKKSGANRNVTVTENNTLEEDIEKEIIICATELAQSIVSKNQKATPNSDAYSNEFEIFWNEYPRKKDKKAAYTKFKTVLKKHGFAVIIKGTKNYAFECDKKKTEQEYIKLAKTFLNNDCFLDYQTDPEPPKKRVVKELASIQNFNDKGGVNEWTNTKGNSHLKNNSLGLF